jgi:hypothetical protein
MGQNDERNVSTTFRLARGSLDGTPRPPRNLRLAQPWVEPVDPPHSPTLRQKSEHLMQSLTTSYPHGYTNNRHGSSTSAKSHFLLPIPGWAVKTYHCTRHTGYYSATDHPRGRIRRVPYPQIPGTRPYPFIVDPPRPVLDPASTNRRSNKKARLACHRIWSLFTVSSSTSSWYPGMAGHSRGTSLQQPLQRSTKLHS